MVTSLLAIVSCPLVRVIVPLKPLAKSISLAPGVPSACAIACRSEPSPLSFKFDTINIDSATRCSSGSTPRIHRHRLGWRLIRVKSLNHRIKSFNDLIACSYRGKFRLRLGDRRRKNHPREKPHGGPI
jgi:hypothetical protein